MQQGFAGNWLFRISYTSEQHDGTFILIFYLLLGHISRLTQLPVVMIFHLTRIIAGYILLRNVYSFITQVISNQARQRLAFILILTSSGLGWLGAMFGTFPIDLWIPEAFVPYSLYINPHFPFGQALMVAILQRVLLASTNTSQLIWLGVLTLLLSLVLPFALLTIWAIMPIYLAWLYLADQRLPWPQIWLTLVIVISGGPIILYDYWVSTTNPILAGWSAQNITDAPAVLDLTLGYGFVGLVALAGIWFIFRQKLNQQEDHQGLWLVTIWAVVTLLLIYIPFNLQRRLISGLHIPICILAAVGFKHLIAQLKVRHQRQLQTAFVSVGLIGTLFVWTIPAFGALQSPELGPPTALLYLREDEVEALQWLNQNTNFDNVILAAPRLGLFIPAQTGARTFYGHPFETVEAEKKELMVEAFYQGNLDMISPDIDYFIYGPDERKFGEPRNLSNYSVAFSTGDVTIYQIIHR